jgi:hypothetical protein
MLKSAGEQRPCEESKAKLELHETGWSNANLACDLVYWVRYVTNLKARRIVAGCQGEQEVSREGKGLPSSCSMSGLKSSMNSGLFPSFDPGP